MNFGIDIHQTVAPFNGSNIDVDFSSIQSASNASVTGNALDTMVATLTAFRDQVYNQVPVFNISAPPGIYDHFADKINLLLNKTKTFNDSLPTLTARIKSNTQIILGQVTVVQSTVASARVGLLSPVRPLTVLRATSTIL